MVDLLSLAVIVLVRMIDPVQLIAVVIGAGLAVNQPTKERVIGALTATGIATALVLVALSGWASSMDGTRGLKGVQLLGAAISATCEAILLYFVFRALGWGNSKVSKSAVDERAKQIARMTTLIAHGLRTKTYGQFITTFSNPEAVPDAFDRLSRELSFQMRISPTCWYDATAFYPEGALPSVCIQGGGDDFGVFITVGGAVGDVLVDLHVASGQSVGRDARAMVRALEAMPGWKGHAAIERSLGTA
jgi:hypothetical protein